MKKGFFMFSLSLLLVAAFLCGCAPYTQKLARIELEDAKAKVVETLSIKADEAVFDRAELKQNGEQEYYAFSVTCGDTCYTCEMDSLTGAMLEQHYEKVHASQDTLKTLDEAKAIALTRAGVDETAANFTKQKLVRDDGRQAYDIEFFVKNDVVFIEYEVEIEAVSGRVLSFEKDEKKLQAQQKPASTQKPTSLLSVEEAKTIALNHAGVTKAEASFIKHELEQDDGRRVYEIEFFVKGETTRTEYDYEVDAVSGKILSYDRETKKISGKQTGKSTDQPTNQPTNKPTHKPADSAEETRITAEKAKQLALAQVPGAQSRHIVEFETDRDDGRIVYEGKIVYDGFEYEFEIDAYSGAIRDWDVESIYDD